MTIAATEKTVSARSPRPRKAGDPVPGSAGSDNLRRAMAFMVVSGLSFALMGATVKLSGDLPLTTKVFFRNIVTLGITVVVAVRLRENPFSRTPQLAALLLRSVCGLAGVYLYFLALGEMSLALTRK